MPKMDLAVDSDFAKHLNDTSYLDIASYLIDFLSHLPSVELEDDRGDHNYFQMLSWLPKGLEKPTFSQFLYFVNIVKLQKFTNHLNNELIKWYMEISSLTKKTDLDETEKQKLIDLRRMAKNAYGQYIDMSSLLMKHLDSSVNREQPKKIDIDIHHSVNVQQMNEFLHKSTEELMKLEKEFVEADYEVKDA